MRAAGPGAPWGHMIIPQPPSCRHGPSRNMTANDVLEGGSMVCVRREGGGVWDQKMVCTKNGPTRFPPPLSIPFPPTMVTLILGGFGTRPRYLIVCLWRRLLASRHCTSRPSVGPNVFCLCQRSPRMTCPV